jgi:hypothetical protein
MYRRMYGRNVCPYVLWWEGIAPLGLMPKKERKKKSFSLEGPQRCPEGPRWAQEGPQRQSGSPKNKERKRIIHPILRVCLCIVFMCVNWAGFWIGVLICKFRFWGVFSSQNWTVNRRTSRLVSVSSFFPGDSILHKSFVSRYKGSLTVLDVRVSVCECKGW